MHTEEVKNSNFSNIYRNNCDDIQASWKIIKRTDFHSFIVFVSKFVITLSREKKLLNK